MSGQNDATTIAQARRGGDELRLQRMTWGTALLLILVAWGAILVLTSSKRQDALAAESRQNTNLARALEEQTNRVLATADQATIRVRDLAITDPKAIPDLPRLANETGLAPAILVQLSLVGADGRFVASNLDPDGSKTSHVDLSSREHVRVHLASQTVPSDMRLARPDDLFISKPVLGKVSKRWTIQISRRIAAPDGHLLGVVVASLDPGYFEDVFRRVSLGNQGGMTLVGADLVVRARVIGGTSQGMGTSLDPGSGFARSARGLPETQFRAVSSLDRIDRIVASRQIARYPLYLLVSTSEAEALAEWRTTRNISFVLTGLLTLAMLVGTLAFTGALRRLERSNTALRASEAQANSANQAKSEFLAAISHELRTPLTSIRGFAELMEERLEEPRFRKQAGLIRKGAEHLNTLLTQILDLAKVEARAMELRAEPVDLRSLVQGTADFFALTAASKGLALTVDVDPEIPPSFACDSLRVKQILNNLLSNALKFTPSGAVTVRVRRLPDALAFDVIDTGPGIPAEKQALIFERFRQADAKVSFEHGGTGLGLALSRGLAELMHGHLDLVSEPGQGACFTLTLPPAEDGTAATPPAAEAVAPVPEAALQ